MGYFNIIVLTIVGITVFSIFFSFFVDLNKDVTFQNRRQRKMRPKLSVVKPKKRTSKPQQKTAKANPNVKERVKIEKLENVPRRPQKRK